MSVPDRDQRTIAPTPRRIQEFRKRGEVANSRDVTMLAGMIGAALGMVLGARHITEALQHLFAGTLGRLDGPLGPALATSATTFIGAAFPAAAGAVAGALLSGVQLGWPPPIKPFKFDVAKLFTAKAIGEMISPKAALGRVLFSTAKVLAVGGAAALAAYAELNDFVDMPAQEARALATRLGAAVIRLGVYAATVLAALAVFDFVRKKRELAAKMRMTPTEAKREHREQEGDPLVRRRRRQRMRELAKRRMETAVKSADVVVVNPTHYAVALRYAQDKERAPRVVAKGTDELAARIREVARHHGVPIVSRPPLARMVHKLVPEGKEIPHALYKAVAEVLAYIYRLRRRR